MTDRSERAAAVLALVAVALAAGLEGGTEHRMGAAAGLVALAAGAVCVVSGPLPAPGPWPRRVGVALLAVLALQALPVPNALRAIAAPGQAARLDRVAGALPIDTATWLSDLTRFDLEVLFGGTEPWATDLLAGGGYSGAHMVALDPEAYAWQVGLWGVAGVLVLVGWRLGRSRPAVLVFLLGMVALALGEALFGFAHRNGPSTGIGEKVEYLGSATGTFINRGHFGAFLNLGLAALWGLAAALFPLLPEEVRRHAARKRRSSQPPGILEGSGDKLQRLALIGFAAATLFVGLVASNSRGPLLGLMVSGLVVGAWMRVRRDERVHLGLGIAAPAVGVALAALALGPRGAFGRFLTLLGDDVSLTSRVELWRGSLAAFVDAPIFGAGAGAWALALGPHEQSAHLYDPHHAHGEPVELLVELGVVGLAAALGLCALGVRAVVRKLDVVDHGLGTATAVGALVGVLAVAAQSLADFPLRTPGVLFPTAVFVGLVFSGLELGATGGSRRAWGGAWLGVLALVGVSGGLDLARAGDRRVRLSEQAPLLLLEAPASPEGTRPLMERACAGARVNPFDPWAQLACAQAASWQAAQHGGADEALVADVAVVRALELQPKNPRVQLHAAAIWARLGEPTLLPNAFAERATQALMSAVAMDGWRAEAAFKVARKLPRSAADRIGAAAASEPVSRARTLYQYGAVLEERQDFAGARAAFEEAALQDPQFGPSAFRAGLLARRREDPAEASRWFHAFLAARSRPVAMEGWTYHLLGEPEAAEVRFRRALSADPKNRWAWEGLASLERARGDRSAECTAWARVLALTPDHAPAQARVAELGC